MLASLSALLRIASRIACAIVAVSFGLFVINQTGSASAHQQAALSGTNGGPPAAPAPPAGKEGGTHKLIDEVAGKLTSPFARLTSGSTSQWVIRGVGTVMALVVYGIGVGFLARVLRLRV
jgi:hypothetical protein